MYYGISKTPLPPLCIVVFYYEIQPCQRPFRFLLNGTHHNVPVLFIFLRALQKIVYCKETCCKFKCVLQSDTICCSCRSVSASLFWISVCHSSSSTNRRTPYLTYSTNERRALFYCASSEARALLAVELFLLLSAFAKPLNCAF